MNQYNDTHTLSDIGRGWPHYQSVCVTEEIASQYDNCSSAKPLETHLSHKPVNAYSPYKPAEPCTRCPAVPVRHHTKTTATARLLPLVMLMLYISQTAPSYDTCNPCGAADSFIAS